MRLPRGVDVSVEYAHIYTNGRVEEEHHLSMEVLGRLRGEGVLAPGVASLVVMVDDYSFPDPSFDYDAFLAWLAGEGFPPDVLFRESQLIPLCDEVLRMVADRKLRAQIEDYVRARKYPCSLFVAAWYLLRLGHLRHPLFPPDLVAARLVNILPESFRPFEEKALEIISKTPAAGELASIEHMYFEGRLLA